MKATWTDQFGGAIRCCAVAGFTAWAQVAVAQTAPEKVPNIDLSPMLDMASPAVPSTDASPATLVVIPQLGRADAAAAPPTPRAVILPMQGQGAARVVRISGETGGAQLFVDLPEVAAAAAFVLSYRTSIDVLPERSQFRITVNGNETAPVTPVSSDGFQRLILPMGLLVAGRNKIDVAVTQAHRIFCGPAASFQIWSEFDLNASGVELKAGKFALNEPWFNTAMLAQVVSGTGVPLRGAEDLSQAALTEIAIRLSGVADGTGGWVRLDGAYGPADTAPDLMRITVASGSKPGVTLRQGAGGVIVLALVPETDGTLAPGLDAYLPQPLPTPDVPSLQPGITVSLADLGFPDTPDASHYIRHDLRFRLPSDWLILASQRASLTLLYSFAASLPKGSLLLVKVNGITQELLPLDGNGGGAQPPHTITFPARLLHPGANVVTFEATVPGDPADLPCATAGGPFLTIFGASDLTVPAAPRMRMIGMGPTLLGLPQSGITLPVGVAGQRDALAEATELALVAQMRPLVGQGVVAGAQMSVVSLRTADQIPLSALGLTRRDLISVLPVASAALVPTPPEATNTAFDTSFQLVTSIQDVAQQVEAIARPGDPALQDWLGHRTGDAALIMPDAGDPAKLWLVIGPSADPVRVAQAVAQARVDPYGPRGQFAILTPNGTWQDWQPASTMPALEEALTPMNFRFVAGNFASWSPLYFVLLLFALTALSVIAALIFVVSTRGGRKL
jgi:cellulose synthase operon protein B